MDEDQARARKAHGPENLARLRRAALGIVRADNDKRSTRGKLERAAWDDAFLLKLLTTVECACLGRAALSARLDKTDRPDAEGLADLLRAGFHHTVYVKCFAAHEVRAMLKVPDALVAQRRT